MIDRQSFKIKIRDYRVNPVHKKANNAVIFLVNYISATPKFYLPSPPPFDHATFRVQTKSAHHLADKFAHFFCHLAIEHTIAFVRLIFD